MSLEVGRVEAYGAPRDYQGLAAMAAARFRFVEVAAHVPVYRIELGPDTYSGLGDVHFEVGWIAIQHPVEAGVAFAVMPPLGSDDHGLAMGHWMLMGSAFARASRGRVSGAATVGYGSRLGEGGHAAHGMPVWPPVAPMNAREIRGTLDARVALWRSLAATFAAAAAAPTGDGEVLGLVGGGLAAGLGRIEIGLTASHGVAGHTARLVIGSHMMISF
ncbi:MAG TPA: hypothetical protein VIG06_10570 [Kofleriaceae bacterium]